MACLITLHINGENFRHYSTGILFTYLYCFIMIQVIIFQHLVNRFAVSSFSVGIHCSIVCDNIGELLRVGCIDVGQQVHCLFGIVVLI